MHSGNRIKYWISLGAFCVIAVTVYFFSSAPSPAPSTHSAEQFTDAQPTSLRNSLNRPIRLYIWGLPPSVETQLHTLDSDRDIDWNFESTMLDDYDVIMVFVNEWNDALDVPFAASARYTPEFLAARRDENPLFDETVIVNILQLVDDVHNKSYFFEVFNGKNLTKLGSECFPKFILHQATYPNTQDIALSGDSSRICEAF